MIAMKNIVFINPLQPGKLNVFKDFLLEITTSRKEEYTDLLNRYGLKNTKVNYHKLGDAEFAVVTHDIEDYAPERLSTWASSTNPFDTWFKEQSAKFYDFEAAKTAGQPQLLLTFDPAI